MRRALVWAGGLSASVAVNGALVVALAAAVAPDPVPQPKPKAPEFDIASYPVPQSSAPEGDATGDAPPEGAATGTRATGRAVPQARAVAALIPSPRAGLAAVGGAVLVPDAPGGTAVAPGAAPAPKAAPITPLGEDLRAANPAGVTQAPLAPVVGAPVVAAPVAGALADALPPKGQATDAVPQRPVAAPALAPEGASVTQVAVAQPRLTSAPLTAPVASTVTPAAVALPGSAPVSPAVTSAPPPVTMMRAAAVPAVPALTGGVPAIAPLASAAISGPVLATARVQGRPTTAAQPTLVVLRQEPTSGATLAQTTPAAPVAPALAPPAQPLAAALAWSGEGAAALDAVSLAAIQAFAEVGDPGGTGPRVRDAISGLLARVPCARLQTVFDPGTGALQLRGHMPDAGLRGPVLAALGAQVGGAIPLIDATLILPRPQCGLLAGVEAVGLPQSDAQVGDPRVIGERPFAAQSGFAGGETLEFEVVGPDYPAFVYVDYFDASGQVIHLQPNDLVPLHGVAPKEMLRTGLGADGSPAIQITVAPPFGQEIMVTFASSVPLYDGVRPLVEPAEAYLAFLKDAVARAQAADADFRGEWYYFFVTTRP